MSRTHRFLRWGRVGLVVVLAACGAGREEAGGIEIVQEQLSANAVYVVRAGHSRKCLDVQGASTADGAAVHQWDCHRRANQQFRLRAAGEGNFELLAQHSGKCLEVAAAGKADGDRVRQGGCDGGDHQRWRITGDSGGRQQLQAQHSGRCLEIAGGSNAKGAAVEQRACADRQSQQFLFTLVTDGSPPDAASPSPGPTPAPDPGTGLTWRKANLTWFTSYPDPGSEECTKYNGCTWAGQFAFAGKQSESWVMSHNIAAVHSKDASTHKLKTLRLRQGNRQIDVTVYDMCADSDCNGCCTANSRSTGFLIDIEKYTADRFGTRDGVVDWACLDCR
jgi:hypothetical protein